MAWGYKGMISAITVGECGDRCEGSGRKGGEVVATMDRPDAGPERHRLLHTFWIHIIRVGEGDAADSEWIS